MAAVQAAWSATNGADRDRGNQTANDRPTITYRLSAWLLTIPIAYWSSGSLSEATAMSTLLHLVLSIDYYLHERIWLRIQWGLRR